MEDAKRYIIVGVLNWGLGHAARSSNLVKKLKNKGFEPILASDGVALDYLKKEFPDLITEELPSYNIQYKSKFFLWEMGVRAPSILKAIIREHKILNDLVIKYNAQGVISDNRLGFYHKKVPCAYITHQLRILLPIPLRWVNYIHHAFIMKFDECWIPDFKEEPSISGRLGHLIKPKKNQKYIGPLSRFDSSVDGEKSRIDVLAVLSGPEPQRTVLEEKILTQLEQLPGEHVLVRGTNQGSAKATSVTVKDLITGDELKGLILSAKMVISRSGYSSLMDYYMLQNKALLIPTPGQVEQEYLAEYHIDRGNFFTVNQQNLQLKDNLREAQRYSGFQSKELQFNEEDLFALFEGK